MMDMSRFSSDPFVAIPVALGLLGEALTLIGLSIAQSRFNEAGNGIAGRNPFSLNWFFTIYYGFVLVGILMATVQGYLPLLKQMLLHFVSIGFVFVVLNLDSAVTIVSALNKSTDALVTGSGFSIAGLIMMSFTFLELIWYLGMDPSQKKEPVPKTPVRSDSNKPMMDAVTIETRDPKMISVETA